MTLYIVCRYIPKSLLRSFFHRIENQDMSSSNRRLWTGKRVVYTISILSDDKNFSPPPNLLFIPSNVLRSECQKLRTNGDKQREREANHAVVLSGDIKSDWSNMPIPSHISRALCLIKHKNSFKFVFIFLILFCHLCLGPSRNYSPKTIMSYHLF